MDDYIKSILKDFFEEAFDLLNRLEKSILILEKNHDHKDSIQEIFRAVHTLKSSSGTVELTEIEEYAHTFEDILDLVRSGRIEINSTTINILLKGIDVLKERVISASEDTKYKGNLKSELKELDSFREEFNQKRSPESKVNKNKSKSKKSSNIVSNFDYISIDSAEFQKIQESLDDGFSVYSVVVKFNSKSPMSTVGSIQIFSSLRDMGTILSTIPSLEELNSDVFYESVSYIFLTNFSKKNVADEVRFPGVTTSVKINEFDIDEYMKLNLDDDEIEKEVSDLEEETPLKQERQSTYLRIESDRIDYMMNQVGELVINKSSYQGYEDEFTAFSKSLEEYLSDIKKYYKDTVMQILRKFEDDISKKESKDIRNFYLDNFNSKLKDISDNGERFRTSIDKFRVSYLLLTRVTNELQDTVMKIRMMPIAQTFDRFPRLIRDLSQNLGKEIDLTVFGEDTKLDKSVIELLVDPLIHLLRNAIDHGIETPEERIKAGKNKVGNILVSASHEGNLIIIKIEDDGIGMNTEDIYNKAVLKGVISPSTKLTEKEIFDLIFTAGFSMSDTVSNVSGRGVGMDVVLKNLQKINGSISIDSTLGKGSTFTLKIPLTLTIIEALIVESEKEFYAVPITNIVETMQIEESGITILEGIEVLNIRDEVINILRIKDLFKLPSRYKDVSSYYAIILVAEDKKIALLVNTLIGEQDIVIKALKDKITRTEGIAGATILGDGTVSFILDIQTIVDLGTRRIIEKSYESRLNSSMSSNKLNDFIDKLKKSSLSDLD